MATTIALQSSSFVHTPGLVEAAQATYRTDKAYWDKIFTTTYQLPLKTVEGLLSGKTPHRVEGESVVFEI